jgi:DNA-binding CsgD family transcriptional regulator
MFGEQLYGQSVPNKREQRVIALVAQGLKNSEVAKAIGATENVVKNYLRVIYDKIGPWNPVELALWYEARRYEIPAHILLPRNDAPTIVPKTPRISAR